MLRKSFVLLLAVGIALCFAACRKQVDPAQMAAIAAQGYYDLLLKGEYEAFVDDFYRPEAIPDTYRNQLVVNARMFAEKQRQLHKGISEVTVANATADTATHTANVFLLFVYGDSVCEQVLVPMVEHRGEWLMR